jgi:hypothetical protein
MHSRELNTIYCPAQHMSIYVCKLTVGVTESSGGSDSSGELSLGRWPAAPSLGLHVLDVLEGRRRPLALRHILTSSTSPPPPP